MATFKKKQFKEQFGNVTVVRIIGDINEDAATELLIKLNQCIREDRYQIVVNMDNMSFICTEGVRVLVDMLRKAQSGGGEIKLSNVNTYTKRLLRTASVIARFDLHPSEEKAIASFG